MLFHLFPFLLLTSGVFAVYLPHSPGTTQLSKRNDPSLGVRETAVVASTHNLQKRTDPKFVDEDFGDDWDNQSKKTILEDSFQDVYALAVTAFNHFDDTIFDKWFPAEEKDGVKDVLSSLVKSTDVQLNPFTPNPLNIEGADILARFIITPLDFLAGTGESDFCKKGADAYTSNAGVVGQPAQAWSTTHFCDVAFGSEDHPQAGQLSDLECGDFQVTNDDGTKRYRVTNEMEPIGATMFHEMMHFNSVGRKSGLPLVTPEDSIIGDAPSTKDANPDDDDSQSLVGEPYFSWLLRQDRSGECISNADNYVWFVLETYWTQKCATELESQGGKFDPPKKPT